MKDATKNVTDLALEWVTADAAMAEKLDEAYYCQTRDVFQARLDGLTVRLARDAKIPELAVTTFSAKIKVTP